MKKQTWFISHPSSGPNNTPTFFNALKQFALDNSQIKIVLPHEVGEKMDLTKRDIEVADLIITEVSIASTGSGIELGWANSIGKSIIAFYQGASPVSPAVHYVVDAIHPYITEEHILKVLNTLK